MKKIDRNILKTMISGICIIMSFFLGYIFAILESENSLSESSQKKFIEIRTKKDAIEIIEIDPQIQVVLNGELTSS